jgi:hypothetical protein
MSTETKTGKVTTLFYSYSHVDEKHRNKLATHLALLKRQGFISEWYDRQIMPGEKWEDKINENLATADVILLLVSADFIASDYCWSKEVAQALDRDAAGVARVIPIIVRAVDWSGAPFGKLQALPKDAKPVTVWSNRDAAWLDVTKGIRKEIEFLTSRKTAKAPAPRAAKRAAPAAGPAATPVTTPRIKLRARNQKSRPPDPARRRERIKSLGPKVKGQPRRIIYNAHNTTRIPGDVARKEGAPPTGDAAVDEAYDRLGDIYSFFWKVFKRDSIDGKGMTLQATVHYDKDYDNAFWMGKQIILGDGDKKLFNRFTSIDIIAKEFGNGLVQFATKLNYWGESGALFHSIASVLAVLVKQYQLKQTAIRADWVLGAELLTPKVNGIGIQSLANPGAAYDDRHLGGKDPQVSHMDNFVKTESDNGALHINAGIPNRAFYTVATTLGGYAWEKAGRIWYEALHHKPLKPESTFGDFARITCTTARRIYGLRSDEAQAIQRGWKAVGIKAD